MSIATEITKVQNNISAAYEKIAAKDGTIPQTQDSSHLADAIDSLDRKVWGNTKMYYLPWHGNVSAGEYVKFLDYYDGSGMGSSPIDAPSGSNDFMYVKKLSDNAAVLIHKTSSSASTLNAVIIKYDRLGNKTIGASTTITTAASGSIYADIAVLNENKIVVFHSYNGCLYGVVCTIDGTTITHGTDTLLTSVSNSGYKHCAEAINETTAFTVGGNGQGYLCTYIATISNMAISLSTTNVILESNTFLNSHITKLGADKFFVTHSSGGALNAITLFWNGSSFNKGTDTVLNSASGTSTNSNCCALNNSKVYIAYGDSNKDQYGILCSLDGLNITKNADTLIGSGNDLGTALQILKVTENSVTVCSNYMSNNYMRTTQVTINNNTLTKGETDDFYQIHSYSYAIFNVWDRFGIFYGNGASIYYGDVTRPVYQITDPTIDIPQFIAAEGKTQFNMLHVYIPKTGKEEEEEEEGEL